MAKLITKIDLCIPFFVVKHACILKEHYYRNLYTPTALKAKKKKKFCNVLETICPM